MAKPDNRNDNVEKLQEMVQDTIENLEEAHETLQNNSLSRDQRQAIMEKNKRREESIRSFRNEIKDEYQDLH
ncbi:small acid-soluble spore protein (minor) [Desulforamulus reducens MI-1]|uniref:Protein Tlp homolog n=1 Tax=Desulforamulus reducens (strain ATCC BAA-1160 / DSM 100696 / MI-1) TaxID=349161 RepID=TLP_DESRM|nr:small acid-soluble spore protein Tlp [Desulforamulus reducens]A4J5G4.1 RecName: Full=Protein Tlp homolog [Desulforamulus reducens MI-1]ABO50317.1 small acid-soluble spore protein (minor) [Desulforamulus reducens MI-1]